MFHGGSEYGNKEPTVCSGGAFRQSSQSILAGGTIAFGPFKSRSRMVDPSREGLNIK